MHRLDIFHFGSFFVKIKGEQAGANDVQYALNMGNWVSLALTAIAAYFCIDMLLPEKCK